MAYAFILREADGTLSFAADRHTLGVFSRDAWLSFLREAGFEPRSLADSFRRQVFIGVREGDP